MEKAKGKILVAAAAVAVFLAGPAFVSATGEPVTSTEIRTDALYPSEVVTSEDFTEVRKIYELKGAEKPEAIPRDDISLNGRLYTLAEITKDTEAVTDKRQHTETIMFEWASEKVGELVPAIPKTRNYESQDGYKGVLSVDLYSLKTEPVTTVVSGTKTVTREFPSLGNSDTENIPKTITEGGKTLPLADISWREDNTMNSDDYDIGDRFTAVATYKAPSSGTKTTGYSVTVKYTGEIVRQSGTTDVYTAIFQEIPTPQKPDTNVGNVLAWVLGIILVAAVAFYFIVLRKKDSIYPA